MNFKMNSRTKTHYNIYRRTYCINSEYFASTKRLPSTTDAKFRKPDVVAGCCWINFDEIFPKVMVLPLLLSVCVLGWVGWPILAENPIPKWKKKEDLA